MGGPSDLLDSARRIADARRASESELKKDIAAVPDSEQVEDYLPAFRAFASSLFDAEAAEAFEATQDKPAYEAFLEGELSTRIIEGILPDAGLDRVKGTWSSEVSVEQDLGSEIIFERGPDGALAPARDEIQAGHAQHGDWEKFTPDGVRFGLRLGKSASVREDLRQLLKRRSFYWLGQFSLRPLRVDKLSATNESAIGQNEEKLQEVRMSVENDLAARAATTPEPKYFSFEEVLKGLASRKDDPRYQNVVNNVLAMWETLARQHSTALRGVPGKDASLEEMRVYVVRTLADAFQTQATFFTAGIANLEDALQAKAIVEQVMAAELARIDHVSGHFQTKREVKDELRTELNIRFQNILATMLNRVRSMGKTSLTQSVPESGSAPPDEYLSGIAQVGSLEGSASQYGNPLLDEIYAKAPDRKSLQQLIENGGHGLSSGAKRVIETLRERGLVHQLVTFRAAAAAASGVGSGNESQQEAAPSAQQAAQLEHSHADLMAAVNDEASSSVANRNPEDVSQVLGLLDRMTGQTSIENWAQENHVSRTQLFEFRRSNGQPVHGKLSKRKCAEIAAVIIAAAAKARARTDSD